MHQVRQKITDSDEFDGAAAPTVSRRVARRGEITLHQIRIFWAIAHAETLTKAAKQLGLAQPSMSQQLAKLEQTIGTRLFDRRGGELILTDAGQYLVSRADHVLRGVNELEEGLAEFAGGNRVSIKIAGISSALRSILPDVTRRMKDSMPQAEFDLHEAAPHDVLQMLYGRQVTIGVVAANSFAPATLGFVQTPLMNDPHVLVTPRDLDLSRVTDPARDLSPRDRATLESSIEFVFGTQHSKRIEQWWDEVLPSRHIVAHCRSFELALAMVRSGAGVCVAPLLSAMSDGLDGNGVNFYRIRAVPRQLVALVPSQYRRSEPYSTVLDMMQDAAKSLQMPAIRDVPPFLDALPVADF